MKNRNLVIPEPVSKIIDVLEANGYEAYIVGGCVRDSLLGISPKDWDITTNAIPDHIKSLFEKTLDIGAVHGTIGVKSEDSYYEVTTFRLDGLYENHRKPKGVSFVASLKEDLSRRDFTINAMAYSNRTGLVDPFGGSADLERRLIKAVGNPMERFHEDALRMLRAVRFSAQLDFEVEQKTLNAIFCRSKLIESISRERIREEFTKTLLSDKPQKLMLLHELNLLKHISPELDKCLGQKSINGNKRLKASKYILGAVSDLDKQPVMRWAMILYRCQLSPSSSEQVLKQLRYDNKTVKAVVTLLENMHLPLEAESKNLIGFLQRMGDEGFLNLISLLEVHFKSGADASCKLVELAKDKELYTKIKAQNLCIDVSGLAIGGNDILHLGFKPGKEIGKILSFLLNAVIEDPSLNTKDALTKLVMENFQSV